MDRPKGFLVALVVLYGILALFVGMDYGRLPERVATHFDVSGEPNGWASRQAYAALILIGAGFTALVTAGGFAVARVLPDSMINLPNKDYWLGEGRRERTMDLLTSLGLAIGCLAVGLSIGVHVLTVRANTTAPVRLDGQATFALGAGFMVGLATATIVAFRGSRRPEE
jgi:hypothetical protein